MWGPLGVFGSIWQHLGASRGIWEHLGAFGSIWGHLGAFGHKIMLFKDFDETVKTDPKSFKNKLRIDMFVKNRNYK